MAGHDIVVIGGSAGALEALREALEGLPARLPAAVFIVIHTGATVPSVLSDILNRASLLPVVFAGDGEPIRPGRVYCAPTDQHLLVHRGVVRVVHGPKENGFRPAIDPLFRSAAKSYGGRVIGVILSGALDDGVAGLMEIKQRGGLAIVQNPEEALLPSMPLAALKHVEVDHISTAEDLPALLARLVKVPAVAEEVMPNESLKPSLNHEVEEVMDASMKGRSPSAYTCPECGGALWELDERNLLRFRCHVGHSYTADSLMSEKEEQLDGVLWSALRALVESAALRHRMAGRARSANMMTLADQWTAQALEDEARAKELRALLMRGKAASEGQSPVKATTANRPKRKKVSRKKSA